jgi:hypothetical protein
MNLKSYITLILNESSSLFYQKVIEEYNNTI